jgi:hypothetical protein
MAHVIFCVQTVFTPVLAKHTKSFNLIDTLSVGVDRIQRDFDPMRDENQDTGGRDALCLFCVLCS